MLFFGSLILRNLPKVSFNLAHIIVPVHRHTQRISYENTCNARDSSSAGSHDNVKAFFILRSLRWRAGDKCLLLVSECYSEFESVNIYQPHF